MVDNFELINGLLDFSEKDTFFFVQVLRRRKENPEQESNNRVINNYYLYSKDELMKKKDAIIADCDSHNARAYINLNRLDLRKIALLTMQRIAKLLVDGDYKAVKNAYASICGSHHSDKNKKWVVDIDRPKIVLASDEDQTLREFTIPFGFDKYIDRIATAIALVPPLGVQKILARIPTKNGIHLITRPFNLMEFKKHNLGVEVHKNNPTLLYIP